MTERARAFVVVAVIAVATLGEGGASASSLVVSHVLLAGAFAVFLAVAPASAFGPSRGPAWAWLSFAAMAGVGAFVAPYAYAAWLVLIEIAAFGTLAWLASGAPKALDLVLPPAIAVLASAHGLAAVVQRSAGNPRPASTFLNPNHLAAWLVAVVLVLAGTILGPFRSVRVRAFCAAAIGLALAGVFVTGSRGAVLGLSAGAVALVAGAWNTISARARRGMLAASAAIVLLTFAGVAIRFRSDADPYRFHRTKIWAASFRAASSSPFFGTRPGQFAAAAPNLNFPLENTPLRFERAFRTPHSDVLRAVCEFGFPAALAAFAAVALAAGELFRRRAGLTGVERGALAALFGLAAQCLVDDLSTRPALTMIGAAFAGLLVARPRVAPSFAGARVAAFAVAFLVVGALGVGEIAGYLAWREASELPPRGTLDAAQVVRLRRSLAWNPMQPGTWQRLAEHFVGDGRTWRLSDYAEAREAGEHAMRLQPADATYARAAARIEATACLSILPFQATRERAASLYAQAGKLARTDATIPLEEAKFLLQAGDPEGAQRAARVALDIEPRASAPRLWLAQAILQKGHGETVEAQRMLDEALALSPRDGEAPSSSYDAALRGVDPKLVDALRRGLAAGAAR